MGDESVSIYYEVLKALHSNGYCLNLDWTCLTLGFDGAGPDNLQRFLFDKLLSVFLKEIANDTSSDLRPLPSKFHKEMASGSCSGSCSGCLPVLVVLESGKVVDLYKLFWVVRGFGGYYSTLSKGEWMSVGKGIGLWGKGDVPALKMVYLKYLYAFEKLVREGVICERVSNRPNGWGMNEEGTVEEKFNGKLSSSMCPVVESNMHEVAYAEIMDVRNVVKVITSKPIETNGVAGKRIGESMKLDQNEVNGHAEKNIDDVDEVIILKSSKANGNVDKSIDDVDGVKILIPNEFCENVESRKRKRETFMEMLEWVKEIAKNPGQKEVEHLGFEGECESSRRKEFQGLVSSARVAMYQKPEFYWAKKDSQILQKKYRMHPSMFEDGNVQDLQAAEKPRSSPRIVSQKFQLKSCSISSSTATNREKKNCGAAPFESVTNNLVIRRLFGNKKRVPIAIGSRFQASLPEWTGAVVESDSKWLGTNQCAPLPVDPKSLTLSSSVGKGRMDFCCCSFPGSVECVRFHIAENRMKLKLELGLTYFQWKFHSMGEEVALSWTEEEENKFKDIVEKNPPYIKNETQSFWDPIRTNFPDKDWKHLVNYYFNVFVLHRRMYQNRETPNNIDSDDDESEFEVISNGNGYAVLGVPKTFSVTSALTVAARVNYLN